MLNEILYGVPIVLFLFKRKDYLEKIVSVLRGIRPSRIYLLSDQGRNEQEKRLVCEVREMALQLIDWPCDVVKFFASQNLGVYKNIALGAKRVFEKEKWAIFLEDDNLPDPYFFTFCREMLERFERDDKVIWICGTNYLEEYENNRKESYFFTQHMLPCGWASWSHKFAEYDFELSLLSDPKAMSVFIKSFSNHALARQQLALIRHERIRKRQTGKYLSWDYHMQLTLRAKGLLGVTPSRNLINNIGVDQHSTHGGVSNEIEMTIRFCNIPTKALSEPFIHPMNHQIDEKFDAQMSKILLWPLKDRLKYYLSQIIKVSLRIPIDASITKTLSRCLNRR